MKKQFIIAGLFLLLVSTIVAADVPFELKAVDKTILVGTTQIAEYELRIQNPYSYEETFTLSVKDFDWNVWSDPLSDYVGGGVDVPAETNYTMHLYFMPRGYKGVGHFNLPITIETKTGNQEYSGIIPISIISGDLTIGEYAIGLVTKVDVPSEVNPGENFFVEVFVENAYPREVKDVTIKLDSELFHLEDYFNLTSLQKKSFLFPITIDQYQAPINDKLVASFVINEQVVKESKAYYTVKSKTEVGVVGEEIAPQFLKSTKTIKFKNSGNVHSDYLHLMSVNTMHRWFLKTSPNYYIVKNSEGTFLAWNVQLEPSQESEIQVTTNFRILLYTAIFILVMVGLWLILKSPVTLNKEAKVLEIRDGAISQLRILIHLSNKTGKTMSNIQLADRVPRLATVVKEFEIGTIPPDKIVQDTRGGTLIKWQIEQLEPYEERIISYRIKSGLQVLGDFVLPSAMVRFTTKGGATLKTKSDVGRVRA